METHNAKIKGTMLGREDHGIVTFFLDLDYGGVCQGAGGYCLDTPLKTKSGKFIRRIGTAAGMELIIKILDIVGVEKWEELKGKHIRARADFNKVYAIGNLLEDKWLDFEQFFKAQK